MTSLPDMDRVERIATIRDEIAESDLDAIWVTKAVNVRWLTGFTGSNGQVLLANDETVLVTDGRYREQADEQLAIAGLSKDVSVDIAASAAPTFADRAFSRLGFESNDLTVAGLDQLSEWTGGAELVPLADTIEIVRQVKDPGERSRLERAASIADQAWRSVIADLQPGVTESWFSRRLDGAMLDFGADALSFDTIVATGARSALPHARPSGVVVSAGDLVVMDFGASVDGYGSDMTRTVVVGAEPTPRQVEIYEAVREAQAAGVAAVRAFVEQRLIDTTCRDVLAEHGLADQFIHGTGHGIGLEIHEQPILSTRSVGILPAGLVVTVEPGVYVSGYGGVRIEDSVVVTDSGCTPITHSPKGLVPHF